MKKNFKHYDINRGTTASLFEQLHQLIPGKQNGRNDIVDVCQNIINKADPYIQYWFIYFWHKIIHETGEYFNTLNNKQKGYYREAFTDKLYKKYWNKFMEKFGDVEFVPGVTTVIISHMQCLFQAYLDSKIKYPRKKY